VSGSGREIERKFLVRVDALPASARSGGARFDQGYLSIDPAVRVRASHEEDGTKRAWLTVKGPGKIDRMELEYEVPHADAVAMLPLCKDALTKIRRRVKVGAHVWDLDEFTGAHAGLWLAEVELSAVDEPFERPSWIGDEVSDDGRYTNAALARAGRAP
jgi:adenylate cyclase